MDTNPHHIKLSGMPGVTMGFADGPDSDRSIFLNGELVGFLTYAGRPNPNGPGTEYGWYGINTEPETLHEAARILIELSTVYVSINARGRGRDWYSPDEWHPVVEEQVCVNLAYAKDFVKGVTEELDALWVADFFRWDGVELEDEQEMV